jgi:hypothetical protein
MFGTHSRLSQWANASLLALLALTPLLPTTVQAAPLSSANVTKRAPTWPFPYGSTKVRGVNLGGWLVLEVGVSRRHAVMPLTFFSFAMFRIIFMK